MITIRDWVASIPPEEKSIAYVGEGEAVSRRFLLTGEGWEAYRDWGFYLDMAFDLSTVTQRESWVQETTQQTKNENFTESGTSESANTSSGTRQATESGETKNNTTVNMTTSSDSQVTDSATETGSTETASTSSGSADSTITKETRTVTQVVVNCTSTTDIAPLSKEVTEEGLVLTWTILRQHTQLPGRLRATMRAVGPTGQVKKTAIMLFEVEPAVTATPAAEIPLSEFQQMEIRMSFLLDQTTAQANRAADEADTANAAKDSCFAMQEQAATAATDASAAANRAENAKADAEEAVGDAIDEVIRAHSEAERAVASADDSKDYAEIAQEYAKNAKDYAKNAKDCSDNAIAAADNADASAQAAAEHVVSAEQARNAAQEAQEKAETAQKKAEEAAGSSNLSPLVANAIIGIEEGPAVRVDDLSPVEHPYTVAVEVESENLIPYPFVETTCTKEDVTFTDNGDGTVTINAIPYSGTILKTSFYFAEGLLFPAGTYVLSGAAGPHTLLRFISEPDEETGEITYSYVLTDTKETKEVTFEKDVYLDVSVLVDGQVRGGTVAPKAVRKDASGVTVNKYGKNLFPYPYYTGSTTLNGVTITDNGDGSLTLNGTVEKFNKPYLIHPGTPLVLPKGVKVSLSGVPSGLTRSSCYITLRSLGGEQSITDYGDGATMVTEYTEYECILQTGTGYTLDNAVVKPQIEIGDATAWAPYMAPTAYTVSADGMAEGLELLPGEDVTLLTNAVGATLRCTYNRDTNKVIQELVNAIISLGGNV